MTSNGSSMVMRMWVRMIAVTFVLLAVSAPRASAKTPDGETPSEEEVCSGLSGAAFGLCNAYCEAQDCDVHDRPSCDQLRENFEEKTGSPIFPCDVVAACGNGVVDEGEDCDPAGSACPDGRICEDDCTCPAAECGDGILDMDEECDPPGSVCGDLGAGTCSDTCTCEVAPPPSVCCQCGNPDLGFSCIDSTTGCAAGCTPLANATCGGTLCVPIP